MQKIIDAEEGKFKLEPWDWWYYAEKVKKEKYDLNEEMLRRAVKGFAEFVVVESEIKRGGPSYSIETVEELVEKFALAEKPGFLIGDDLVEGFPSWKNAQRLSQMVDLFVARRTLAAPVLLEYPHHVVSNTILPISSSEIRRRISEGRTVRFLLPDAVLDYIKANKLYG